jgi:Zn-dependent M28 family amino/carboxypeptidase
MARAIPLVLAAALSSLPGTPAARLGPDRAAGDGISANRIRADVEFLADDLLEGREAFTRGYDVAARYVAAALKAGGYEPAGDNGTFYQSVPLVEATQTAASLRLTVGGKIADLAVPGEALGGVSALSPEPTVTAPVVFAGYGVTAPDFGHDDFAGLDVNGKIVAVLSGAPAALPSEPRAHYSGDSKFRNAAEHGAIGVVTLLTPEDAKGFPWGAMIENYGKPQLARANPDGTPALSAPRLRAGGVFSVEAARKLFASSPVPFEKAVADAAAGKTGGIPLNAQLTVTSSVTHRRVSSPNVVGKLEGSHPALAATSVVLSAHLDHTGLLTSGEGDRINNGAYDNALGAAITLEVARVLAAQPVRPKRSVVVVFVTAEEKGLLGSDYFARYPGAPVGRIIANLNLDMPTFLYGSKDLIAFGSEHSTLDTTVHHVVAGLGYTLSPDPMPEQMLFIRSDQYSFVKQGIPAVYLLPGFTATDASVNGQQVFREFLAQHYHKPSDDLSLPMDLSAIEKFTRANYAVAKAIADDPVDPAWKPGNFFGKVFGKEK